MASAGSSFPSAPPQSLVTPTPPQSSGTQAPLQTLVTVAPSRSSVSAVLLGSISSPSLPWDPLTSAMSPLDVVGHANTLASPSIDCHGLSSLLCSGAATSGHSSHHHPHGCSHHLCLRGVSAYLPACSHQPSAYSFPGFLQLLTLLQSPYNPSLTSSFTA